MLRCTSACQQLRIDAGMLRNASPDALGLRSFLTFDSAGTFRAAKTHPVASWTQLIPCHAFAIEKSSSSDIILFRDFSGARKAKPAADILGASR
jgi:hypothetical protein